MNIKSKNGIYQIEIPGGYMAEEDNGTLAIYNDDSVGAISITSFHIPQEYNFIMKNELLDFIQSIDKSVLIDKNNAADCGGNHCNNEFLDSIGKYWRVWVLLSNNNAVFVSYNCANADKQVERDNVCSIVRSLILID